MTMHSRGTLVAGLAAIVTACSGGGGDSKGAGGGATSPTSSIPVSVAKQAGDAQTGVVGATIAAPVVKVLNFSGVGVAGIVVTFTSSNGDVLGASTVTTGADGTASAVSWRLGTVAGTHTVNATATGVAVPASFTASVSADVARAMAKSAGDNQTGFSGSNVTIPPGVTIADQYGNPVSGTSVAYSVATGGGSVTGSPVTSNANGVAAAGAWRLGPTPGPNTLVATATGLPSVTFTANGVADPCNTLVPIAVGQTLPGTLTANDCLFADDYYADLYSFPLAAGQGIQMDMASSAFNPWIDLGSATNADAYYGYDNNGGGGTAARIRLLGPAGQYLAIANSFDERATGAYTFGVSAWSGNNTNCETDVWLVPAPAPFAQSISTTDCSSVATGGTSYYDGMLFMATAGRTYTITMASTAVDPVLTLRTFSGQNVVTVGTDDNGGGGTTARITWTPTADNVGIILAQTAAVTSTGAYTLSLTSTGMAAEGNPLASRLPAKVRAARRLAFARADAPSVFLREPARTAVRAPRRP